MLVLGFEYLQLLVALIFFTNFVQIGNVISITHILLLLLLYVTSAVPICKSVQRSTYTHTHTHTQHIIRYLRVYNILNTAFIMCTIYAIIIMCTIKSAILGLQGRARILMSVGCFGDDAPGHVYIYTYIICIYYNVHVSACCACLCGVCVTTVESC